MRLLLLLLAAFALSGCWIGTDFYDGVRPQHLIPAGDYMLHDKGARQMLRIRVETLAGGTTRVTNLSAEEDEEQLTVGFFPLPGAPGRFVAQVTEAAKPAPRDRIVYSVIGRRHDGSFEVAVPRCGEPGAAAEANQAEVIDRDGPVPLCAFRSRAALEWAAKALPAAMLAQRRLVPA